MRRFRPDSSTLSVAYGLARRPERTPRRRCLLGAEIGRNRSRCVEGAAVEARSSLCQHRMERQSGASPLEAGDSRGRRLRHRGSPVLLARCHISSIGLASVSRQVCGRHSVTPGGLPARAGGPGRRGCRIRSRPSAATGPACRRGTAGRGRRRRCREPTRARQVQDRCPGSGG